ncbi:conserved hypothetical protein [Afipia carboxidovorans OM5]|nr:conserved hypothetical protein [Afipia carboxidovorans OM5]
MAFEQDPNDQATEAAMRRRERLERELQPDPELAEGPASGGRIALFAIAVLAILGVVLYGLNSTSDMASNPSSQTTANSSSTTPPATMPNSPNTRPGQTTGSSMTPQPAPPAAAPSPGGNAAGSNAPSGASSE